MADALWIDEDYLMANSVIAENSDMKVITPNILYVQDAYIKPLLGTTLFNVVQAEINAQVYSSRIQTLLNDYLYKVIMNYVLSESASDFAYRWTNKGLMQKNSENSQPIQPEQLKTVQEKYKNRAEVFAERTTNYLLQYATTYPEYLTGNTTIDSVQPNVTNFKTGISMGDNDSDRNEKCWYRKRNA